MTLTVGYIYTGDEFVVSRDQWFPKYGAAPPPQGVAWSVQQGGVLVEPKQLTTGKKWSVSSYECNGHAPNINIVWTDDLERS